MRTKDGKSPKDEKVGMMACFSLFSKRGFEMVSADELPVAAQTSGGRPYSL